MAKVLPISYTKKVRQLLTESEINKIRIIEKHIDTKNVKNLLAYEMKQSS
jgi:hypothetical protein